METYKAIIILILSGTCFIIFTTISAVWIIQYGPKNNPSPPTNDSSTDEDYDYESDQNFAITYSEENGLVITIYNEIRKTTLRGIIALHRGHQSGSRIRFCDTITEVIGDITKGKKDLYKTEDKDFNYISEPNLFDEYTYEDLPDVGHEGTCIELDGKGEYEVKPLNFVETDIECQSHTWKANECGDNEFTVCFDMSDTHWYGSSQIYQQKWPIEQWVRNFTPYITGYSHYNDEYGGVQERYWLSSDGLAIYVDWNVPLWVAINESGKNDLCLRASYKNSPYQQPHNALFMNYTICQGLDVKHVHQFMVHNYLGKPQDIPDEHLFKYPISSTSTQFRNNLNQTLVLEFAQNITDYEFPNAQLEIGDKWESDYGALDFDTETFPNPRNMIEELTAMGFRTTLWVHPFVNIFSDKVLSNHSHNLVKDPGCQLPALTQWWNGIGGILDFTLNNTCDWFKHKLWQLQTKYGVSNFYFDAGEASWLPAAYTLAKQRINPNWYTRTYAELANSVVASQEKNLKLRIGTGTQNIPLFISLEGKSSTWGYDNGLKSIIPQALTLSIIGYPFIMSEKIGGNAHPGLPDKELYIRWIEATVFLPGLQFSIPPWIYQDHEVTEITRKMVNLHIKHSGTMIELAKNCVTSGQPIIRPLWWADPLDKFAQVIDSEFLVGDLVLVAPVLEAHSRARDIYIPFGQWNDVLQGKILTGPKWLYNYPVRLEDVPYFYRLTNG